MKLFAAGISHKTAPVELREQLAVKQSAIVDLAFVLKSFGHLDEIVLLSTCNRVEIYGTTRQATRHIKSLLQLLRAEPGDLDPHIYLYEGAAAVRHLLRVTAGLDSMVLGETEITGQIKNAYEVARKAGLTGRVLNRLFQRAFRATKENRTRTEIGRGIVSIKSTAVELIGKTDLSQQSIMVLGAGEMAESCVRLLVKKGAESIFISNRSFDRALDLATCCGGEAVCSGYSPFRNARGRCCHRRDEQRGGVTESRRRRQFNEVAAQSAAVAHRSSCAAQHRSRRAGARACRSI